MRIAGNYTVDMRIAGDSGNLSEDIRQTGSASATWAITVEIGPYADSEQDNYYPVLTWNPDEFGSSDFCYHPRLYSVDDEGGLHLLVQNMRDEGWYQTKEEDGQCVSGRCFLNYAIILSNNIDVPVDLPAGWSLISLPVMPDNAVLSGIFPEAKLVYGFDKDFGYVRIDKEEELKEGEGYWILMPEAHNYTLTGAAIEEITLSAEYGWFLIGSCTSACVPSRDDGIIKVIYSFDPGFGYQRVEYLESGKGYWILISEPADEGGSIDPVSKYKVSMKGNNKITGSTMKNLTKQDESWRFAVTATGQDLPEAISKSRVYIGMADTAVAYPIAPSSPPNYTVDMRIAGEAGNLSEDIRQRSSEYEVWNLIVEIGVC